MRKKGRPSRASLPVICLLLHCILAWPAGAAVDPAAEAFEQDQLPDATSNLSSRDFGRSVTRTPEWVDFTEFWHELDELEASSRLTGSAQMSDSPDPLTTRESLEKTAQGHLAQLREAALVPGSGISSAEVDILAEITLSRIEEITCKSDSQTVALLEQPAAMDPEMLQLEVRLAQLDESLAELDERLLALDVEVDVQESVDLQELRLSISELEGSLTGLDPIVLSIEWDSLRSSRDISLIIPQVESSIDTGYLDGLMELNQAIMTAPPEQRDILRETYKAMKRNMIAMRNSMPGLEVMMESLVK